MTELITCSCKRFNKRILLFALFLSISQILNALQIDIGIFQSAPNRMDIRIKPDFTIHANQTFTNIIYTVRWVHPGTTITTISIEPYDVIKWGNPVYSNGFYYQRFFAFPSEPVGTSISPGEERLIASFTFSNSPNPYFEVIKNNWTQVNYGNPYFELQGFNRTGIIYHNYAPIIPLEINCPQDIITNNQTDLCGAVVVFNNPVTNNPGASITQISGLSSGAFFPVGTTTNTFLVTDPMNVTATCSFFVVINDTQPPEVIDNQSLNVQCTAEATEPLPPLAADNCGTVSPVLEGIYDIPNPLVCEGSRVYVYSYTDGSQNMSYWAFTYYIDRTSQPYETGGPVSTSGGIINCISQASQPEILPTVIDACGNILQPAGPVTGGSYNGCEGELSYIYTYVDCADNEFQWLYNFLVLPTTGPVLIDPESGCSSLNLGNINKTVAMAQSFDPSTLEPEVAGLYTDNCGEPVVAQWVSTIAGNDNYDLSWTFDYNFAITDACGFTKTCTVTYSGGIIAYDMNVELILVASGENYCYSALHSLTAKQLTVNEGGSLTLIAGSSVRLLPDLVVESGGYLMAQTGDSFCYNPAPQIPGKIDWLASQSLIDNPESRHTFFLAYPNPANDILNIDLQQINLTSESSVEIYSLMGGRMLYALFSEKHFEINLSGWPKGVYLIRISNQDRTGIKKVIKN